MRASHILLEALLADIQPALESKAIAVPIEIESAVVVRLGSLAALHLVPRKLDGPVSRANWSFGDFAKFSIGQLAVGSKL